MSVSGKKAERIKKGFLEEYFELGPESQVGFGLTDEWKLKSGRGTAWAKTGNREIIATTTATIIATVFE